MVYCIVFEVWWHLTYSFIFFKQRAGHKKVSVQFVELIDVLRRNRKDGIKKGLQPKLLDFGVEPSYNRQ
jgi:hypothetical protein